MFASLPLAAWRLTLVARGLQLVACCSLRLTLDARSTDPVLCTKKYPCLPLCTTDSDATILNRGLYFELAFLNSLPHSITFLLGRL